MKSKTKKSNTQSSKQIYLVKGDSGPGESGKARYPYMDLVRGLTVVQMVTFHFFYYLSNIEILDIDFWDNRFWYWWPRFIVFTFYFIVGMNMGMSYAHKIDGEKIFWRLMKLFVGAIVVTLTSYWINPHRFIYFGTLHSIFCMSLLLIPFLRYPKVAALVSVTIFIAYNFLGFAGWPKLYIPGHWAYDYIPVFPWGGVGLLGLSLYKSSIFKWQASAKSWVNSKLAKPFQWIGQRAFGIYFAHHLLLMALSGILQQFNY